MVTSVIVDKEMIMMSSCTCALDALFCCVFVSRFILQTLLPAPPPCRAASTLRAQRNRGSRTTSSWSTLYVVTFLFFLVVCDADKDHNVESC